jgi:hypothetical protein
VGRLFRHAFPVKNSDRPVNLQRGGGCGQKPFALAMPLTLCSHPATLCR